MFGYELIRAKSYKAIKIILMLFLFVAIIRTSSIVYAKEEAVYKDDIYCYQITNETKKEVTLIGVELQNEQKELSIPGKVTINGVEYTVRNVDINFRYYTNADYKDNYRKVTKLNVEETFSGIISSPVYVFPNVTCIEFFGKTILPEKVDVEIVNNDTNLDVLYLVPSGMEKEYEKVIHQVMNYSVYSDIYEHNIPMTPTIATSLNDNMEYGCFQKDGFIYQVTKPAGEGVGEVQLIGITNMLYVSYVSLPDTVTNNGYTYRLTKLCKFGLVGCKATVVIVPNSVTKMESDVFGIDVELLFLSKNCKVIPSRLITDENYESRLRFVYVPEGVTTLSEDAFNFTNLNKSSIILPTSLKSIGKRSVYGCKLVTFLNKKPIANIASAVKNGTTVKVNQTAIKKYKSILGTKISVVAAKNITKSTKLSINTTSLKMKVSQKKTLKGTLTKGSNETIYWLSSDNDILEVSDKGVIKTKSKGTAYVVAYTRTSGLRKVVKVTVTN